MTSPLDRLTYGAAVLFAPAWAGVFGGELSPSGPGINVWDKELHFSAYFILSLLAVSALQARKSALGAVLALIAMGGLLEIWQGMIGRDCDIYDEFANSLGVLAGAAVAWIVVRLVAHAARA